MSPLLPHYYLGVIRGNSIWRISICIERVDLDICQQPSGFLPSKAMLLRYMQILGCFIVSRNNGCTIAFILVGKISQVVICEVAISWYFASFSPCKSTFSYWITSIWFCCSWMACWCYPWISAILATHVALCLWGCDDWVIMLYLFAIFNDLEGTGKWHKQITILRIFLVGSVLPISRLHARKSKTLYLFLLTWQSMLCYKLCLNMSLYHPV